MKKIFKKAGHLLPRHNWLNQWIKRPGAFKPEFKAVRKELFDSEMITRRPQTNRNSSASSDKARSVIEDIVGDGKGEAFGYIYLGSPKPTEAQNSALPQMRPPSPPQSVVRTVRFQIPQ